MSKNNLAPRQRDVLTYFFFPNKEIARLLGVKENTVKNTITQILIKLGAENKTQAVILALRMSVIRPEEFVIPEDRKEAMLCLRPVKEN